VLLTSPLVGYPVGRSPNLHRTAVRQHFEGYGMWLRSRTFLPAPRLIGAFLAGCAEHQDRRLADDQQTCQAMGHPTGSDAFKQCLTELNKRRCRMVREGKTGPLQHKDTPECERLR